MIKIQQKRVRNLNQYRPLIEGKKLILTVDLESYRTKAERVGFTPQLEEGETVLPAVLGSATRFNSFGKGIVRRDLPMETHYRQVEWTWKQFSGRDETVEITDICDVPYKKYPRDFVPPPGLQLTISNGMIASPQFSFPDDEAAIIHAINVFLEVFGECRLLDEKLDDFFKVPSRGLNWVILPPGKMPWSVLEEHLKPILERAKPQVRRVFEDRLKTTLSYMPEFQAAGLAGSQGYIVFGFPKKNLYICESIHHGNALYVFEGENWEEVTKKTKAEILQADLHKDRIIHYEGWKDKLHELLGSGERMATRFIDEQRSVRLAQSTSKEAEVSKVR